jgi:hypothetical protein
VEDCPTDSGGLVTANGLMSRSVAKTLLRHPSGGEPNSSLRIRGSDFSRLLAERELELFTARWKLA